MNRATRERILLDRRLIERKGWIEPAVLERELEKLPDVSRKIAPVEAPEGQAPADPAR
mgnify:CR=1 FL=1